MSAYIQNLFDFLKRGASAEMNRPRGRFPASGPVLFALLAFVFLTQFPLIASARIQPVSQDEDLVAAYIVKETGRPEFLKSKEIDKSLSPASLTKIMTCLMAIESGRMDDVVSIPLEATQVEPTRAGFEPGERIRLRDLVKAAMVNSSNDAAFAIAMHLGGSVEAFVASMNNRARALGMTHTFFTNPAGYDRGIYAGNHSSARDLMILTERTVRYPEFNAIAKLDKAVFSEQSTGKSYCLRTHNKLLDRYPHTVGIKTGYTSIAGPCLVARALKDGKDMLIIMLGARTDRWSLASNLFEQGFGPETGRTMKVMEFASESSRKDTVASTAAPSTRGLAERSRALVALRRKVAKASVSETERGIHKRGKRDRSVAKSSVKADRRELSKTIVTVKSHGQASRVEKIVLKASRKGEARKQLMAKVRQRNLNNRLALKSAKKSIVGKVALKSRNSERHTIRTARKGSAKRTTADVKSEKRRSGKKEELSMSRKPNRSPNG